MKRRDFLGLQIATILLAPFNVLAGQWNRLAFQADHIADAEKALAIEGEIISNQIEIIAPSRAENGAIVQVAVHSSIANTEAIAIFVDKNPTALIANYLFFEGALPSVVTRIKMAQTSEIKVIVKSGHRYFTAAKQVIVLENGCGGSSTNEQFRSSMKIRAKQLANTDMAEVKAIITHPMHTGQGLDEVGQIIPAHFIQMFQIKHNDVPAIEMQLGTGIARNPYLTCQLQHVQLGDKISVRWQDNLGIEGQAETSVIL